MHILKSLLNSFIRITCTLSLLTLTQPLSWSAENEDTESRIERLESENTELRQLVEQMQKQLKNLENKLDKQPETAKEAEKKKKAAAVAKDQKLDMEETISGKDEAVDNMLTEESGQMKASGGKGKEWLPSRGGEEFRLGGRLQVHYFDPKNERLLSSAIPSNPGGSFEIDEFRIYLDGDFKNKIRFHSKIDIEQDDIGLIEAYVDFGDLPLSSQIRAGLQSRFYRPGRYTEYYPITQGFWKSRDIGLTWMGDYDPVFAYASILNGVVLDDEELKKDDSDHIIGDDNNDVDFNGAKEFSLGLGFEHDFQTWGKVEVLGFGTLGKLSEDDLTFLFLNVPGYPISLDDDKEHIGVNLEYKIDEWDFFAQAIKAWDGELERTGWYAEGSYKFNFKGLRYLNSLRPLVRYGMLDINIPPTPAGLNGALTWDRQQWTFALISEITRNVIFRTEYMLNEEDTGGPNANNNEFLVQLEVQF